MSQVIALIPARAGSKGCVGKNLRKLCGRTLIQRAIMCAVQTDIWPVYVTTDIPQATWQRDNIEAYHIERPPDLASDTAAMVDVVRHALREVDGPEDQIVCLLQPTAVFRTPARVREAIAALTPEWDSVVTMVPIPRTHAPALVLGYCDTTLSVFPADGRGWANRPTRRQDVQWPYIADGTAYVFRRRTVREHGNIYGELSRGLVLDPSETCSLDSESDWADVERRWKERHG